MTHLVGSRVLIPGDQWEPKETESSAGTISKSFNPTVRYPKGRIEVTIEENGHKFVFPIDKFPTTWITSGPELSKTTTKLPKTPRAASRKATELPTTSTATDTDLIASRTVSSRSSGLTSPARRRGVSSKGNLSEGEGRERSRSNRTSASDKSPEPSSRAAGLSPTRRRRKSVRSVEAATVVSETPPEPEEKPDLVTPSQDADPTSHTPFEALIQEPDLKTKIVPHMVPQLPTQQTLINGVLLVLVAVPAVLYGAALSYGWGGPQGVPEAAALADGPPQILNLSWWLAVGYYKPFLAANLVFFLNVDVLFWILSLIQGSTWLIDPYWTIIPVLVGWFYQSHPRAVADPLRSITSMTLLCLWSARLTHSYFRREEWQLGAREDWRFTDMAKICGRHWPWLSFFAAYLSQHVMLMGITWPFFTIHSSGLPWDPLWDFLATATAVTGIVIACIADTQLQSFKVRNELRKAAGLEPVLINESGLFYYSRHPNYFGELLWWWGVGLFAFRLGQPIVLCGALINTLAMIPVTIMVEERMMRKPERVEAFREYCRVTSVWVPWPRA